MQISVTFRQLEPTEALKNYVTERLNKFKRYLDGPVEAHVVLGLEKFRHLADVTIDSNGGVQEIEVAIQRVRTPVLALEPTSLDFGDTQSEQLVEVLNLMLVKMNLIV